VGKSDLTGGAAAEDARENDQQLWPMGAVTRRTGIGEHTLRAWERRFGFPTPLRLESGHRRYSAAQVRQLLLIAKALSLGHRAGDVVPLPVADLESLLYETGAADALVPVGDTDDAISEVVEACRKFDREALVRSLRRDSAILGMSRFLRERVAPLLHEVGEEWSRGGIEVRHEHFFTEVLEDELRMMRSSLQVSAGGRPVVLASLPSEAHALGLQIAALAIMASGRAVRVLGPQLPPDEIVAAANAVDAAAVGISVSLFAPETESSSELEELREKLPKETELWAGGEGANQLEKIPAAVKVLPTLDDLDRAVAALPV
jgi:methylmalonyl-CoA mutase cobalamin-binding subunit